MAWRGSFVLVALVVACGGGSTAVIEKPCAGGTGLFASPLSEGAVTYTVCGDFTSVVADRYDEQISFTDLFWHDLANTDEDTGLPIFPEPVVEDERYTVSFEDIEGGRTYTVHGLEPGQKVRLVTFGEERPNDFGHSHRVVREDYVESVSKGKCVGGIGAVGSRLSGGAVTYTVCGDFTAVRLQPGVGEQDVFNHDLELEGHPGDDLLTVREGYHVTVEEIEGGRTYTVHGLSPGQSVSIHTFGGGVVPEESQHRITFSQGWTVVEETPPAGDT
jgi:hypothetical protein